jgi:hypothetical protein
MGMVRIREISAIKLCALSWDCVSRELKRFHAGLKVIVNRWFIISRRRSMVVGIFRKKTTIQIANVGMGPAAGQF